VRSLAELAFPVIKDLLKAGIFNHLENFVQNIKEQFEIGNNQQSENAKAKAQDAEARANAATTPEEATRYKAVAEVWREVAEGLKKENQELKREVESKASVTEVEVAKYQAKAETWREAYENIQKENERLKIEIDNLKISAVNSIKESVSNLQMSDVFDVSNPDKIELKKNNSLLNPSSQNDVKQ
jgi:flagellar motor protein MotB